MSYSPIEYDGSLEDMLLMDENSPRAHLQRDSSAILSYSRLDKIRTGPFSFPDDRGVPPVRSPSGSGSPAGSAPALPLRMPQFTFALCALPDGARIPVNAPLRYVLMDPSAAGFCAPGAQAASSPLVLLSQNTAIAAQQPQV